MKLRGKCRSCKRDILWLKSTSTGRLMPVDLESAPDGNVAVHLDRGVAEVLTGEVREQTIKEGVQLHLNHFVTCPEKEKHRKTR